MSDFYSKQKDRLERNRKEVLFQYLNYGLEFYKRELDFNYQFIIFLGLIAGFGFTAIQSVRSNTIFFAGEMTLLLTVSLVLYRTKKITSDERAYLLNDQDKRIEFFKRWSILLQASEKENRSTDAYNHHLSDLSDPAFASKQGNFIQIDTLPASYMVSSIIGAVLVLLSFGCSFSVSSLIRCVGSG